MDRRKGNACGFLRKTLSEVKRVAAVCGFWDGDWNCGVGSEIGSGFDEYDVLLGFAISSSNYLVLHDS